MNTPKIRHIKIEPYGVSTATPFTVLDFNLPRSGFVDLSTLLMFFDFTHSDTSGTSNKALSKDSESIIDTLEVSVNGVPVNVIKNYNQVFRTISNYALTHLEREERGMHRNCLLNGNPLLTNASTVNDTYCCKKWLGFLGCKEVIDLSQNQIHIRITTAERFVIAGGGANDTYSLSNIFMTARYFERYDNPLKTFIEFEDFKTLYTVVNTGAVETSLKFIGDNVDYAVATFFPANQKGIFGLADGVTRLFTRTPGCDSWNFKVNGKFMYSYDVPLRTSQMTMYDVFPNGFRNVSSYASSIIGLNATTNSQGGNFYTFHAGCPIKMKLEQAEELEITFLSKQNTPASGIPHFLMVKLDKAFNLN